MSLCEALCLIYEQGSNDSKSRIERVKKKIRSQSKAFGWEESLLGSLDDEWRWRICCARLSMGYLDWKGWQFRRPREGLIPFDFPFWDGRSRVKNLLLLGEQGLGDEVMFASILNDIDFADNITVDCEKRLQKVFSRSFPHIEFVGREHLLDNWANGRTFDAQFLMGDLAPLYRRSVKDFPQKPYLIPEPMDKTYSVGISWKGRQGGFDPEGIEADVSLQYDEKGPFEEPDFDLKNDIDQVISLIATLDKVISAPTSVVHFAGALGVPADVILPKIGQGHGGFEPNLNNALNWRFEEKFNRGDRMLFHPSVKIYPSLRQWKYENRKRLAHSNA